MSIPIKGPSHGSAGAAYEVAKRRGAMRIDFVLPYLKALYADAATVGIRADVLVSQADLETAAFTSLYWVRDGNPAGLAAFDDGSNWGLTFTPEKAARAHVTHMLAYLGIEPPVGWKATDARWQAVIDAGYFGTVTTTADLGNGRWATDSAYGTKIEQRHAAYTFAPPLPAPSLPAEEPVMAITYGKVPIYGYVDRYIASKRQGFGWDNLGPRNIKFVTLHRMVGTLQGTDGYFRDPSISSYTDFGLSTKLSDPGLTPGTIYLWNYPSGIRAPWASGPVSAPYGDGKAIVDKYGVNAVNRDGISLEIGGYNEPIDEASWKEIVWFIAYWADQCKVPYTSFPLNPATGISFVIWHNEFTAGTGKQCPFMWLRDRTPQLIADVKAFMRPYQEGGTVQPEQPAPAPSYPALAPIPELADKRPYLVTSGGSVLVRADLVVKTNKATPRLRYADAASEKVGPDIAAGESFGVDYLILNPDGSRYWLTPWSTRVKFEDTEIVEAEAA